VKLDSTGRQARKLGFDVWDALIVEQNLPRLVVRRVDRDVKWRKPIFQDALDVALLHVGKSREISVGEGEPVVVVPDIEGLPQSGRQPFDEAELALVGAASHRRRLERDPEGLAVEALELVDDLFTVGLTGLDHELLVGR